MSTLSIETTLPEQYQAIVSAKTNDLKMLPTVALQALKLIKRPDCSIVEFAEVVERDPKLATDMLKLANSTMYSPGRPISDLNQAVIRLGMKECKNLIMTSSIASLMKTIEFREEWIRDILWRHSFLTAIIAMHLSRALGCRFHGEEFTGGLLHDFGRTLLAHIFPDEFLSFDSLEFEENVSPVSHEIEQLGLDHTVIGAWFAQENQLPDDLVAVIKLHHDPHTESKHSRLVALVSAADDMANHLQKNEESAGYRAERNAGVQALRNQGLRGASRFEELAAAIMDEALVDVEKLIVM